MHAPCDLPHQSVLVHSIKELFQIEIDHPAVAPKPGPAGDDAAAHAMQALQFPLSELL